MTQGLPPPIRRTKRGPYFFNGYELLEGCDQNAEFCLGYVTGAVDTLEAEGAMQHRMCHAPSNVTTKQMTDVVHKYLRAHAENRQNRASFLMLYAMEDAFPCAS